MNITEESKNILFEIQKELKEESNVEMSIEEIADIVESQFLGLQFGIKKGLDVRLPFFGTFYRKFGKDAAKKVEIMNKLKNSMDEKEFKRKEIQAKIKSKKNKQERLKAMPILDISTIKGKEDKHKNATRYDE